MATISMRCVITIVWAFVVCCNCQSYSPGTPSSWDKLQISPDTDLWSTATFSLKFRTRQTTTANQKKYFFFLLHYTWTTKVSLVHTTGLLKSPRWNFVWKCVSPKAKRKLKYLNLKTRSSVTKLNLIKWGSFPWRRSFSIATSQRKIIRYQQCGRTITRAKPF